jgi:hypothetical protein
MEYGGVKRSAPDGHEQGGKRHATGDVVIKILVAHAKIGGVIGKGGTVINQMRQETNARIKAEDSVPGCIDRVVSISGSADNNSVCDALLRVHFKSIELDTFEPAVFSDKGVVIQGGCEARLLVPQMQVSQMHLRTRLGSVCVTTCCAVCVDRCASGQGRGSD